jgi:hypothetical protein
MTHFSTHHKFGVASTTEFLAGRVLHTNLGQQPRQERLVYLVEVRSLAAHADIKAGCHLAELAEQVLPLAYA